MSRCLCDIDVESICLLLICKMMSHVARGSSPTMFLNLLFLVTFFLHSASSVVGLSSSLRGPHRGRLSGLLELSSSSRYNNASSNSSDSSSSSSLETIADYQSASAQSCVEDQSMEEALDRLSLQLAFGKLDWAAPNSSLYVQHAGHHHPPAPASSSNSSSSSLASHSAVARARIDRWFKAAVGVPTKGNLTKAGAGSLAHRAGGAGDDEEPSEEEDEEGHALPPACVRDVPENHAYWDERDTYWKNGQAYVACRYNKECKGGPWTNRERVAAIRRSLHATKSLLDDREIPYTLFGGSAIGQYRCEDVLPWDLDCDVLVPQDSIPKLRAVLQEPGSGWRGKGRSLDMEHLGLPGFVLMEKLGGCIPLVVVDKSTGFFCDVFPARDHGAVTLSPWWTGGVACDAVGMFSCYNGNQCQDFPRDTVFPASKCKMYQTSDFSCPKQMVPFLHSYVGPQVANPDVATTTGHRRRASVTPAHHPGGAGKTTAAVKPNATKAKEQEKEEAEEEEVLEEGSVYVPPGWGPEGKGTETEKEAEGKDPNLEGMREAVQGIPYRRVAAPAPRSNDTSPASPAP